MNKILSTIRRLFCIIVLISISISASANHLVGMDFYYTWISGNTYKITLIAYANCGSGGVGTAYDALPTCTPAVYIYNGPSYLATILLAIEPPSAGVEITPVCPADLLLTQCTDLTYTIPGIKKFVYSAEYTLPSTSSVWRFCFTGDMTGGGTYLAGRATSITNIVGPDTYIQLVDTLNNTIAPNTSPNLSVIPTPFFCLDNLDNYNPGAIPADGDSLTFFLVPGMAGSATSTPSTTSVTYGGGFSATAPLTTTSFSFDEATGQISFDPSALQRSLVVYNIEQHRGGVLVGTSQREMTFLVLTCTTSAPSGGLVDATNGPIDDSTHFHICQNTGAFSLNINPTEADLLNTITVTYAGLPTGATMTITGNGTTTPHCTFSWTSTGVAPGSYTFYVTYTDDNCPLSGVQTLAYTITVVADPTTAYALIDAATCFTKAYVSITPGGAGIPWKIKVSEAGDTIQTFPVVTAAIYDSLAPGTYTLTVFSSVSNSCVADTTITVPEPAPVLPTVTFTNPSYCGDNNGTITLHGLVAGSSDSINFTFNGVAQPVRTATVASDGTVVITGLLAGSYSGITATYGRYCVSSPAGPVTLVNPAFTMRALTFTDPAFCGICNGTITLYGLRPGETDTISYTLGGIAQPPIHLLIPADSMVSFTGLCAGSYDNFTAETDGVCISNVLGPANLIVPAFTMRTITFTSPSYCGVCDGSVTLYGLHPGQVDTITYTRGGAAQPPFPVLVPADSMVTITGLCVGTYDNFVARTAEVCISNTLGPVTLTAPPFTMRALTFTNPSYCGICNGTVTLYGLHPGETDTISYTIGGVVQPPVVFVIPDDSMVTLTGLCAGVYAGFVAKASGPCISNTLGPVTLTVPPFTVRSLSSVNPTYCGICNGSITLYGLHPGETDTVDYIYNGTAATPVSVAVPADSMVTLSGLCSGVYTSFVVKTGGDCVSNTLGPVTLTVPPFTVRALTYTNPDYCGICNGTVTIYGLHPGEVDTIDYTDGGGAVTPFAQLVPADSIITITGLCAGDYDNFVAKTGGVCVSNTLGPANLTVPPFTMRAISYTNPTKCGFCDGSITLYGLHPGETDTINYMLNGVAQAPVIMLISSDSAVLLSGLCKGAYSGFVANTGGVCVSNVLGPVTLVAPPIIPAFTSSIIENCKQDTVLFTNMSTPPADLTYTWYFGDGLSGTETSPSHVYYLPGIYNVTLDITNTKCDSSLTEAININNLITPGFTASPDSFLCQGSPVAFTNTSVGTSLQYAWYFGDGYTSHSADTVYKFLRAGVYQVMMVVSNFVPCYDTVLKTLDVDSISAISFDMTDSVFCRGDASTFTGIYSLYGNTGLMWTFGDGDSIANINPVSHTFDATGVLTVKIEAFYRACPDTSATRDISVYSSPEINLGPDTSICLGSDPMYLVDNINESNKKASWKWNTGQATPQIMITEPGTYYATVTLDGCQSTDSVIVQNGCYMDIPNAFTPNGDGINDYFYPRNLLSKGLATFKLDIYNRWGELVFETTNTDGRGWDGRFNNVAQPEGVFVYMIDATFIDGEKEHHTGNVTLLR